MSITVYTNSPSALLSKIKQAIEEGHIVTWACDQNGDFTHSPSSGQWNGKAYLHPHVLSGKLTFGLTATPKRALPVIVYAVYHGRFTEMLLSHFDHDFTGIMSSGLGDHFDRFNDEG